MKYDSMHGALESFVFRGTGSIEDPLMDFTCTNILKPITQWATATLLHIGFAALRGQISVKLKALELCLLNSKQYFVEMPVACVCLRKESRY